MTGRGRGRASPAGRGGRGGRGGSGRGGGRGFQRDEGPPAEIVGTCVSSFNRPQKKAIMEAC